MQKTESTAGYALHVYGKMERSTDNHREDESCISYVEFGMIGLLSFINSTLKSRRNRPNISQNYRLISLKSIYRNFINLNGVMSIANTPSYVGIINIDCMTGLKRD